VLSWLPGSARTRAVKALPLPPGERTFSWFGRNRRLAKDFENLAETLASFVTLASIQLGPLAARQGAGRELNRPPFCIAR